MSTIKTIEKEIEKILVKDKRSWVRLYELIREVDIGKLWRPQHTSFTRWIQHLAYEAGVTESLIWKRKKAGEIYFDYQQRAKQRGVSVPKIEDITVSPDNFELVEKISQGNDAIKDDLMEKVLQRDLKRSDLLNAWDSVKTMRKEEGHIIKKNAYTEIVKSTKETEIALTVSDIAVSLTYSSWLNNFPGIEVELSKKKHKKTVYKLFPSFSFYSLQSNRVHTIDFLLLENHTCNSQQLTIHSIEVVLSRAELKQTFRSSLYKKYMNYLWVAVPSSLLEEAEPCISEAYGILEISNKKIVKVWRNASYRTISNKLDIIQATLIKML